MLSLIEQLNLSQMLLPYYFFLELMIGVLRLAICVCNTQLLIFAYCFMTYLYHLVAYVSHNFFFFLKVVCLQVLNTQRPKEHIADAFIPLNCYHHRELTVIMIYTSGVVKSKRSIWRLKTITDFFWTIVNFIGVFFATMFSVILVLIDFNDILTW